jgi:hypothetical protein
MFMVILVWRYLKMGGRIHSGNLKFTLAFRIRIFFFRISRSSIGFIINDLPMGVGKC